MATIKTDIYRSLQAISKMQITFKDKARADEKAQHTWEYVSILKRLATPYLGVICIFEMACSHAYYEEAWIAYSLYPVLDYFAK